MPHFFNPDTIVAPASRYSQGALCDARARRLIISGQIGVRPDGSVAEGLEAQMEVAWDNLEAVLAGAGMTVHDLVKITGFCVPPGSVATFRTVRDRRLKGHAPACTYIEAVGLASPIFLFEIEGEALREE
jgi:enamine deaminase RidA (YjgF/YER057c/UK114 family)